ncbi:MAG: acyltransferase family protein [Terriglobales bacterium]
MRAPAWLPDHIPALDGIRGWAIVLVLLHHCLPRLQRLGLAPIAAWGWTGVDLFFVLSGFLITGIVLDGRGRPKFFRNFYARRALRIWPVFALVVPVNYFIYGRANTWNGSGPFVLYLVFFVYNLMPGLTGTLYPAWSLAIEEQFYLVWAPVARRLPARALAALLSGVLVAEPWLRRHLGIALPIHTLYHLDGLALGAMIALGLRTRRWDPAAWRRLGGAALAAGAALWWWADRGHGPWLDSGVALSFAGLLLLAVSSPPGNAQPGSARRSQAWVRWLLAPAPLRFLGKISYGLYLTHMLIFAIIGGLDAHMDRVHAGAVGDAAIVAARLLLSIGVATLLWHGFERPILGLKRHFPARAPAAAAAPG